MSAVGWPGLDRDYAVWGLARTLWPVYCRDSPTPLLRSLLPPFLPSLCEHLELTNDDCLLPGAGLVSQGPVPLLLERTAIAADASSK